MTKRILQIIFMIMIVFIGIEILLSLSQFYKEVRDEFRSSKPRAERYLREMRGYVIEIRDSLKDGE